MRRAGAILITIFACLIMLEFGLRAIGRRPTNMADGTAEQDGDSFKLKSNTAKVIRYPAFTFTAYTNEFGFRDRSTGPRDLEGKPIHAFLGASDVFGNGVEYEKTFVGIYAEAAKRKGIEVLNLAVGGHYFLDQERLLKIFMETTPHKPSTVLFCVNALHIPKFDHMVTNVVVRSGYPMGRDGWQITYVRLMAGNISSAFCFFRDGIRKIQERWLDYQPMSKNPEFLESYLKTNSIRQPARIKEFEEHLGRFEAFCREYDIELIYVYLPLSDSFRLDDILLQLGADPTDYDTAFYERQMISYCEKTQCRIVNITPALQRAYDEGHELRFKLDPHFNEYANDVIGQSLIKALL